VRILLAPAITIILPASVIVYGFVSSEAQVQRLSSNFANLEAVYLKLKASTINEHQNSALCSTLRSNTGAEICVEGDIEQSISSFEDMWCKWSAEQFPLVMELSGSQYVDNPILLPDQQYRRRNNRGVNGGRLDLGLIHCRTQRFTIVRFVNRFRGNDCELVVIQRYAVILSKFLVQYPLERCAVDIPAWDYCPYLLL
jgi:hypothetical protein